MTGSPANLHVWRPSEDLAAAIVKHAADDRAFITDVITPFDDLHPHHKSLWAQGPFGIHDWCMGFGDDGSEVPAGLSRSRRRKELIPRRNAAGKEWTEALDALNKRPNLDNVFKLYDVDTCVSRVSVGRRYFLGIDTVGGQIYLRMNTDQDRVERSIHLIPVKLSEYFAAKEAAVAKVVAK